MYWLIQHTDSGFFEVVYCAEGSDPLRGKSAYCSIRYFDSQEEAQDRADHLNVFVEEFGKIT